MLKECKTKECQNTLQQLQWKEQQKEGDEGWKGFKYNGNKKQADNGQKPLGMEEDYWNSRLAL